MIELLLAHAYPSALVGWIAIAAGVAGFSALVLAILGFLFGGPFAGPSDVVVGLAAFLSAALAMLLFPRHYELDPQLALLALALAIAGAFGTVFGSVLATTRATGWFLTQLYVAAGDALLGLWLILFNRSAGAVDAIPNAVETVGLLAGAVMALGLGAIPGILAGRDTERLSPWISRYLGRAGDLGSLFLFPLWCIMLGRALLRL